MLKTHTILPVVLLVVGALLGLIILQVYLLRDAFELKEQAFRRNVVAALGAASRRLETDETLAHIYRVEAEIREGSTKGSSHGYTVTPGSAGKAISGRKGGMRPTAQLQGNSFSYQLTSPQRVRVQLCDSTGRDTLLIDTLKPAGNYSFSLQNRPARGSYYYRFNTDSSSVVLQVADGTAGNVLRAPATPRERAILVSRVVENLSSTERMPIERRIQPATLDSVIHLSMLDAGILLPCFYGVTVGTRDSLHLISPVGAVDELRRSDLRAPLFLSDVFAPRTELVVDFPGRDVYLLRQLWPVLLATVTFIAVITLSFVYTIRMIMRQQRLAGRMVDFINNMTHEFKTPISTVALASEAIGRPDVVTKKARVLKYNRMIADETQRMKKQVDRILQMAVIESGDYELTLARVDMHQLIESAVENITLQVDARGGTLKCALEAEHHVVDGDVVHLTNIIHNLLDNANKYSPGAPSIRISTANDDDRIVVCVADRGIGIAAEYQKQVFDKYYRVPTGNLHDVKGFGLGLSYVRLLVEAHGGDITLSSRLGEGTEVVLRLPLKN